nr:MULTISPECIES: GNAT family N-acetyltransferase [Microbacterium]
MHEWREVRDLRIEAVSDPAATIAFLSTREEELARDDAFWQRRAADASLSDQAAQFIAAAADRWVGTATVLLREPGTRNHLGHEITVPRADVVGVYLAPEHRGTGILPRLFDEIGTWVADRGIDALHLDVHAENVRAQTAYRKAGFVPTGVTFTSTIGPEIEMRRGLG